MKRSELVPGVCYAAALGVGARDRALGDDYGLKRVIVLDTEHIYNRSMYRRDHGYSLRRPMGSERLSHVGIALEHSRYGGNVVEWVPETVMPAAILGTWEEHERLQPIVAAEREERHRRIEERKVERQSEIRDMNARCAEILGRDRPYASMNLGVMRVVFEREQAERLLDIAEIARDLVYAEGDPDPALMERLHEAVTR